MSKFRTISATPPEPFRNRLFKKLKNSFFCDVPREHETKNSFFCDVQNWDDFHNPPILSLILFSVDFPREHETKNSFFCDVQNWDDFHNPPDLVPNSIFHLTSRFTWCFWKKKTHQIMHSLGDFE